MEYKGSFIGFTFDGVHSSQLGILRTSNSNRYNINLTPKIVDTTTDLATTNGVYYWGSKYGNRELSVSYAFFGLSEKQLGQLKTFFNGKKYSSLIFDEEPYKVWTAKVTGSMVAKYVCFQNGDTRFYAGSGEFQFTSYSPYAQSREEYLERYIEEYIPEWREDNSILSDKTNTIFIYPAILSYDLSEDELTDGSGALISWGDAFSYWLDNTSLLTASDAEMKDINSYLQIFEEPSIYNNLEQWKDVSRIPSNTKYGSYSSGRYLLYNAGDIEMPFKIYFSIGASAKSFNISTTGGEIVVNNVVAKGSDKYVLIDMQNDFIMGCDENFKSTGNLYNEKISAGNFFKLPIGECSLVSPEAAKLEIKYLYF